MHPQATFLKSRLPGEKVSWDDIQVFLTRLNVQEVESPLMAGRMYCPRKLSGSMPAGQARPQRTHGEIALVLRMQITTAGSVPNYQNWFL